MPEQAMPSVHHDLNDDLASMANPGWQNRSEFGRLGVSLSQPDAKSLAIDASFTDTWHYAPGSAVPDQPAFVSISGSCLRQVTGPEFRSHGRTAAGSPVPLFTGCAV